MKICYECGIEITDGYFIYRKEWNRYWHYRCYQHDRKVEILLPVGVVKSLREGLLKKDSRSNYEEEFLYVTNDI